MAKRISSENLEDEVLQVIGKSENSPIGHSELLEKMVEIFWDLDTNDFRTAIGALFAREYIRLGTQREITLTAAGRVEYEKLVQTR